MTDRETVINNLSEFVDYARIRAEDRGDPDAPFHLVVYSEAVKTMSDALELLKGGWISCGDRLPEFGKNVLTYSRFGHVSDRELHKYISANGDEQLFFSPDGMKPVKDITHWMPITKPPKEGEK